MRTSFNSKNSKVLSNTVILFTAFAVPADLLIFNSPISVNVSKVSGMPD